MQHAAPTSSKRSKFAAKASPTGSKPGFTKPWTRVSITRLKYYSLNRLARARPHPAPIGCSAHRRVSLAVDRNLDRKHTHVDERGPKATGQQADQGSEHADHKTDSGDDEKPPIGH